MSPGWFEKYLDWRDGNCLFYHVIEYSSYHGMSRQLQASYTINFSYAGTL